LTPRFLDDLQEIDDARKTAIIDMELTRLQMDIVALQETGLPDSGSVRERNFTFFGSWDPSPADVSKIILSLKLHSSVNPVTLIMLDSVIPRRSKGQTGNHHQGNPCERATVHSRLVLIKVHGPFA